MMSNIIQGIRTSAVIVAIAVMTSGAGYADTLQKQLDCLAKNVYFEARGEPLKGQLAVAWVTLNRVQDGRFADDVCGVVHQPGQFVWLDDGHSDVPRDAESWNRAQTIAALVYAVQDVDSIDPTNGSIYFHAGRRKDAIRIGAHVFYKTP